MKFKTTDLIERIDNLLRHLEGQAIDRAEKLNEERERALAAWIEEHDEGFRQFALRIKARLGSGQPVTVADIPASIKARSNSELKFYWEPGAGRAVAENRQADNLLKLKAALQASTEEAVSPTALKQLGFQDATFLFTPEAAK